MKVNAHSVLFISLLVLLSACKGKETREEHGMVVNTAEAKAVSEVTNQEFPFIAQPRRTSELSFRVGGPIDRFDVYAGNSYKRGDIIAEIDPRDFHIRRERAEAVYNQAKAEFERIQVLYEKDNLSASAYEKAKADYTSAKTAFNMAVNELEDTRLIAPFNGYVGEVYIEKYQDVKATQPVLSFIDIDQLKIEIYVTQSIAAAARSLDAIELRFDTDPDTLYKARVIEISKGTTRNNLSYLLTALLPNEDGGLLAGMSGKALLDILPTDNAVGISIPQSALCHRPSVGDYVWIVDPESQVVSRRSVQVEKLLPDGKVKICAGLKLNETVAVSGLRFLSDGMKVVISESGRQ
ncbi:efflux RND transporter periplasmic adaptor subunit [Parabacteroides sp. BX2]|jgi:RND family efflux transporter MFP subunit|uniref:Efflux RND transporter periplasmic adaptor subunit n=1 Tax=Parabacteroides segnis TaxID=2763058 RepID=A0ABR7DZR2_9BACT|nr:MULTISPECIES: efflux RND transporter periplasmic adaptor subunit [Parabacteroides]MBC5642379.1 efflux RND transporter periplasmic adaptor subunit [Parabacteroides segnis]MCM0712142.1 efflux RND transporter periplasmic adaptor subunit [Parabacteroides sp. TA-V-105]